uniref:Uncharacterized protein n=1 Tax=Vitrella brassicaformis TaxID=1169539 RepID=A0A7S1JS21_9ALVE|mmetsp:Transcript_22079/g.54254  ORF Transcript_22079/g.54254 Transcript_22079/m.54254 type:complete len:113 (+) Transcript_22079:669-1007(+)
MRTPFQLSCGPLLVRPPQWIDQSHNKWMVSQSAHSPTEPTDQQPTQIDRQTDGHVQLGGRTAVCLSVLPACLRSPATQPPGQQPQMDKTPPSDRIARGNALGIVGVCMYASG